MQYMHRQSYYSIDGLVLDNYRTHCHSAGPLLIEPCRLVRPLQVVQRRPRKPFPKLVNAARPLVQHVRLPTAPVRCTPCEGFSDLRSLHSRAPAALYPTLLDRLLHSHLVVEQEFTVVGECCLVQVFQIRSARCAWIAVCCLFLIVFES